MSGVGRVGIELGVPEDWDIGGQSAVDLLPEGAGIGNGCHSLANLGTFRGVESAWMSRCRT